LASNVTVAVTDIRPSIGRTGMTVLLETVGVAVNNPPACGDEGRETPKSPKRSAAAAIAATLADTNPCDAIGCPTS
jgi:hypothetical protein